MKTCANCGETLKNGNAFTTHALPDAWAFCGPCRDAEIEYGFQQVCDHEDFAAWLTECLPSWTAVEIAA